VKEKLSAEYLLSSPFKIKELYDVFNDYVYTNLKLQDILKIGIMVKS
jgi:hypothetical protein